jgi:hypothetical protein
MVIKGGEMGELTTDDLPADLAELLRDQSVVVPQDAAVFEAVAAWVNAPSAAASAELATVADPGTFDLIYSCVEQSTSITPFDHRPRSGDYSSIHQWINRTFPRVGRCEWCAATDRETEYATARADVYTSNRADWLELCIPCHRNLDGTAGHMHTRKAIAKRGASQRGPRPQVVAYLQTPEARAKRIASLKEKAQPGPSSREGIPTRGQRSPLRSA